MMFPKRITVELTSLCNLSCTFCPRECITKNGMMSEKLYKKIIDEMARHLPVTLVPFFRGESLLHPKCMDFLRYAVQKGIKPIQFTSNGLMFDEDIAREFIDIGIDFVSFSLDTLDEKKYKTSRLRGDLHKSMNNVLQFSDMCAKRKIEGKFAPTIQVSTINTKEYEQSIDEFVDFWRKHVDIVRVYEEHDERGRFRNNEVSKIVDAVCVKKTCKKIYSDMVICWDGSLAMCCYDWIQNQNIGNVEEQTIEQVWNGDKFNEIRKMFRDGDFSRGSVCDQCEHWKADFLDEHIIGKKILGKVD